MTTNIYKSINGSTGGGGSSYSPTTPGDWNPVPSSVSGALDQLAASDKNIRSLKNAHQIYLDFDNGNDTTGTGSIIEPIKTLQHAVTLVTSLVDDYVFILAPGNYTGVLVNLPANVSMVGVSANVSCDIVLDVQPASEIAPIYSGVSFQNFEMDLSPANVALPVFLNAGFNITRLDATTGAHAIQIHDGSISNLDLTGNALINDVLFVGSTTVQSGGGLILNGCVLGINVDVFGTGNVSLVGCTFSGSITGTTVLGDTPTVTIDASSLSYGGSITGCDITFADKAPNIGYTPTTPGNWSPTPTVVSEALDQLAANSGLAKYEQTFTIADWVGPSGGEYSLIILEATHLKGINPHPMIFEDISGNYELTHVSTSIANTGTITFTIVDTPDIRFDGKITIV